MKVGDVASIAAITAVMASAVVWYHETDNEPLIQTLEAIETNSVVARLGRIYRLKCEAGALSDNIEDTRQELLLRYMQLTGREYQAPC